ncbi:MAG: hypothetical protein J6S91_11310 [Treponema sp.]|nr:hypothetical protein [Treponema sp.]
MGSILFFLIFGALIFGVIFSAVKLHGIPKDSVENRNKRTPYIVLMIICIIFFVLFVAMTAFIFWLSYSLAVHGM